MHACTCARQLLVAMLGGSARYARKRKIHKSKHLGLESQLGHLATVTPLPGPSCVKWECVPGRGGEPKGVLCHALSRVPSRASVQVLADHSLCWAHEHMPPGWPRDSKGCASQAALTSSVSAACSARCCSKLVLTSVMSVGFQQPSEGEAGMNAPISQMRTVRLTGEELCPRVQQSLST